MDLRAVCWKDNKHFVLWITDLETHLGTGHYEDVLVLEEMESVVGVERAVMKVVNDKGSVC